MKLCNLRFYIPLACAIFLSSSAQANTTFGGLDGSGGSGPSISPETVDKVVKLLPEFLPRLASRMAVVYWLGAPHRGNDPLPPSDQVLKAWFLDNKTSPLINELHSKRLRFVSKNKCTHNQLESDASYSKGIICFNRQRLAKNSTPGMVRNVVYLAFHELAHHFGFNEELAQALQKDLASSNDAIDPSRFVLWNAYIAIHNLSDNLDLVDERILGASDLPVCHALGSLNNSMTQFMTSTPILQAQGFDNLSKLLGKTQAISGFCQVTGSSDWDLLETPVPIADRTTLVSKLATLRNDLAEILANLKLYLAGEIDPAKVADRAEPFSLEVFLQEHDISMLYPEDNFSRHHSGGK